MQALGPQGLGVRLAGLCDIAELRHVRRGLEGAGMTANERIEDHGFHACDADLEDELIRAVGTAAVERVLGGLYRRPAATARPQAAAAVAASCVAR